MNFLAEQLTRVEQLRRDLIANVSAILEAHHSAFGVESSEGSGTTFWFELEKGTL